ncbi:hypothetical protein Hamer_G000242 [Homarus americanus]|uniref:Uncharacterized protein n=1 Tax=Homarus americanus TaxID=6706 RepID=A0A8J5NCG3_HOMAM|nr:hypothetical protein Hamer_G000242 [Homarus americanus]
MMDLLLLLGNWILPLVCSTTRLALRVLLIQTVTQLQRRWRLQRKENLLSDRCCANLRKFDSVLYYYDRV